MLIRRKSDGRRTVRAEVDEDEDEDEGDAPRALVDAPEVANEAGVENAMRRVGDEVAESATDERLLISSIKLTDEPRLRSSTDDGGASASC